MATYRNPLAIVEPQQCEAPDPHTTGIERLNIGKAGVAVERGPMPEQYCLVWFEVLEYVPRLIICRRVGGAGFDFQVHAACRCAEPDTREDIGNYAQPRTASEC